MAMSENDLTSRTRWVGEEVPGYIPMQAELVARALQSGSWEITSVLYAKRRLNMIADLIGLENVQKIIDDEQAKHPDMPEEYARKVCEELDAQRAAHPQQVLFFIADDASK
jgi:hypothetical protein